MVYTGINNQLLGTDNLSTLKSGQIDSLDIGNAVILDANGEQKTFIVSKKSANEFCMTYTSTDKIIEVKYAWENGAWAYDETTEKSLGEKPKIFEFYAVDLLSYFDYTQAHGTSAKVEIDYPELLKAIQEDYIIVIKRPKGKIAKISSNYIGQGGVVSMTSGSVWNKNGDNSLISFISTSVSFTLYGTTENGVITGLKIVNSTAMTIEDL